MGDTEGRVLPLRTVTPRSESDLFVAKRPERCESIGRHPPDRTDSAFAAET